MAVTIYVATTGDDSSGNGTSGNPYKTIPKAIDVSRDGDTMIVGNGTYSRVDNSPAGNDGTGIWLKSGTTIKAANKRMAVIDQDNACKFGFQNADKNGITIDGLEIKNCTVMGINFGGANANYGNTVRNCLIHHTDSNGISTTSADMLTIEGNEVHHTAETVGSRSGISLLKSKWYAAAGPTPADGFRARVINNNVHHTTSNGMKTTDGNGIILDKLHYMNTMYRDDDNVLCKTLVEGNYCWRNRGAGIRAMGSMACTIRYNTCWANGQRAATAAGSTWGGALQNQNARSNIFRYNIGVASLAPQGGYANNFDNDADYYQTRPSDNNTVEDNVFYGFTENAAYGAGKSINISPGAQTATDPPNEIGSNPLFVDPGNESKSPEQQFALQSGSPARNMGAGGKHAGAWQEGTTPPDPEDDVSVNTYPVIAATDYSSGKPFTTTAATYNGTATIVAKKSQTLTGGRWLANDPQTLTTFPTVTVATKFRVKEDFTGQGVTDGVAASNEVTINPASVVTDTPPVMTAPPVISGTTAVGSTLSSSTGTWTGNPTPVFIRQWKRNGVNISGATTATYLLVAADAGTKITVTVTAANGVGSPVPATSAETPTITGTTPPDTLEGLTIRVGTLEGKVTTLESNVTNLTARVSALEVSTGTEIAALKSRVTAQELYTSGMEERIANLELKASTIDQNSSDIEDLTGVTATLIQEIEGLSGAASAGRLKLYTPEE